jgi:hypothetical protein
MLSWLELERLKRETVDLGRYSVHVAISLSLVSSLTAIAILSKQHLTHPLWADAAAIAVPMPIALHFRSPHRAAGSVYLRCVPDLLL